MAGRPTKYTTKLAADICRRLTSGESLRSICRDEKMPHIATVMEWALGNTTVAAEKGFPEQYTRARQAQAELYADDIIGLADDEEKDPQRSKLQVDARKWVASRLLPKVYGDRKSHEVSGPDGGPIPTKVEVVIVDAEDAGDGR